MNAHRSISAFAAILLLPLLSACETQPGPEPGDAPPEAEGPSPEGAADPDLPEPEMEHTAVQLDPVEDSGVEGEALLMDEADALVVVVEVVGLPGPGEYPMHVHEGSCDEGGPVSIPLEPVTAEEDGSGTSTTTLDRGDLAGDQDLFVNLHAEDGTPIACGDL